MLHFSKSRFPAPPPGSHLVDIRVFDTVDGARCEYDQDERAFKPAPPGSDALVHNTMNQLEIVINLNMQDTQTLLHQHLPTRLLKNLTPCKRAEGKLTDFSQIIGSTEEDKALEPLRNPLQQRQSLMSTMQGLRQGKQELRQRRL